VLVTNPNAYKARDMQHLERKLTRYRAKARARAYVQEYLCYHSCVDCGEDVVGLLTFDHLKKRNGAKTTISDLVGQGVSIKRLRIEIAKCVVRCEDCHRDKHCGAKGRNAAMKALMGVGT